MTSIITQQVEKAIRENLPSAIGEELQLVLKKAQDDAKLVERQSIELSSINLKLKSRDVEELSYESRLKLVEARELKVTDTEHSLALAKKDTECANRVVAEIKTIVGQVFGSNRMNYNVSLDVPVKEEQGPNYSTHITRPLTGSIKTEA